MKRILEVNVDDKGYGGVFAFVMNVIKNISYDKIVLDVAAFEPFEKKGHKEEIRDYGGEVYECLSDGNFVAKQWNICRMFFGLLKRNQYQAIHIHSDVAYKLLLYGMIGELAGVEKIIVHSHSAGVEGRMRWLKSFLQKISRPILSRKKYIKFACSCSAAQWMYTDNVIDDVQIITNGIRLKDFRFDPAKRIEIRKELELNETDKVVGTVARFSFQKYPEKLLGNFSELLKINPGYKLLWVGEGPLADRIKDKAKEKGIADRIIFYGVSDRVNDLYQAMDVFVMTSRFEGLGIVILEAQAAGLPCVCSDVIPSEVIVSDSYYAVPLQKDCRYWASIINGLPRIDRSANYDECLIDKYDIKNTIKMLMDVYL